MAKYLQPSLRPQRQPKPRDTHNTHRFLSGGAHKVDLEDTEKSSLDFTQLFERKFAEYSASDNIFKRWILEISCLIISALCMGVIVGIYVRVNGKSMLSSEQAIAWVNVLGKIAAATLIVPTSEALGQLKWNWFHKSRVMWDFEIFDKASRGPWGAVMLLFRTRGRSLAAFGALLIVLLLAIDTFFQQVVEYPQRWFLNTNLRRDMPRVVNYKPPLTLEYRQHLQQESPDRAIVATLREYFYYNGTQPVSIGNGTRPDVPLSCPTSSCTWPVYETLAVCSQCEDVSQDLDITYTCMFTTTNWSTQWTGPISELPYSNGTVCGYYLNATADSPILLSGYVLDNATNATGEALLTRLVPLTDFDTKEPLYGDGSIRFKNVGYPLLDGLIASVPGGLEEVLQGKVPDVQECMLAWCIQTIQSSYEWGVYSEDIVAEYLGSSEPVEWPYKAYPTHQGLYVDYTANVTLQQQKGPPGSETTYSIDKDTISNIVLIFDDIFPSYYTIEKDAAFPMLRYNDYGIPWTRKMEFNPWQAPNNLTRHMQRLAKAVTNVMRSSTSHEMLYGKAYDIENYVSVRWEWLIFPFALLLLSLAFLVATMVKTSEDTATGMWKTSAMPTLIYGLPEDTRGKFAPQASWNSSNGDAKKVRIKLMPNLGWRVSGQSLLRSPLLPTRSQPPPGWI